LRTSDFGKAFLPDHFFGQVPHTANTDRADVSTPIQKSPEPRTREGASSCSGAAFHLQNDLPPQLPGWPYLKAAFFLDPGSDQGKNYARWLKIMAILRLFVEIVGDRHPGVQADPDEAASEPEEEYPV
jgi:hypothetical protein